MQPSEEIKSRLDIVDFIREYIPLKAAGQNFRARCPFHREKTPSFMVSPDKQIWHCFGCGRGGDIFKFVMEMEGIEFVEALRLLAPKAGVTLKRTDPSVRSERNRLFDILDLARRFYHQQLLTSSKALPARKYLQKRGLTEETITEWQIGYSPDDWRATGDFLRSKGFNDHDIMRAGMVIASNKGGRPYDRFRGRIMFPLADISGQTVGFSARISPDKEEKEKMGKYINSPQTIVYDKSKIIFGLDKARQHIRQQDYAIIVEGQMDVISAHQFGYKNTVASSGTALTSGQLQQIKRYSNNIKLAFDMDEAGQMAADRGISAALSLEMNIKVIELPSGKDPDECLHKDPKIWKKAVANAEHMMDYFIKKTLTKLDLNEIVDRRRAVKEILPMIHKISNRIERDYWLKRLSEEVDVSEQLLKEALGGIKITKEYPKQTRGYKQKNTVVKPKTREEKISELIIAFIFKFPVFIDYVLDHLPMEQMVGSENSAIYKNLVIYYNNITAQTTKAVSIKDSWFAYNDFREWFLKQNYLFNNSKNQPIKIDWLVFLIDKEYSDINIETAKKELIKLISELNENFLKVQMRIIGRKIAQAEKKGDKELAKELAKEFNILSEEYNEVFQNKQ